MDYTYIENLVMKARQDNASDIHLVAGIKPKYRVNGRLEDMTDTVLSREDMEEAGRLLNGDTLQEMGSIGEVDDAKNIAGIRCRLHLYRQQNTISAAIRLLSEQIPLLDGLGLPPAVYNIPSLHKGIVLVTGETGSGKSTTLAALINEINRTRYDHIVTLEDPVEYIYTPDKCIINQREVGRDTLSFADGLRASLREDPNVILIGEMRDRETIETAITAAETGHLVLATLHTGSAADSIDRIVQVFPDSMQQQIRLQLSMTLVAVLTQQLIPKKQGGRALAAEMMVVTDAIRNLIRDGKTPQINTAIQTSADLGGQTMDQALLRLVKSGAITKENALHYCKDSVYINKNA